MQTITFNIYTLENQVVHDAYSLLTANMHFSTGKEQYKIYTLLSSKPGNGKTTLSINLAVTLARSGWKVLLIDADLRKPGNAKRLGDDTINGLSDYLSKELELPEVLCKTDIQNLTYLSCGKNNSNPIGLFCSEKFSEFCSSIRNDYDFILFDTPAMASVIDGALIASKSDAAMLVAEMGETSLDSLKRVKAQLDNAGVNTIGVVLNKVKKRDYRKYFESYNYFFGSRRRYLAKKFKKAKPAFVKETVQKGAD